MATRKPNAASRLKAIEDTQNQMSLLITIGFAIFIIIILCVIAYLLFLLYQKIIRPRCQRDQEQKNESAKVPTPVVVIEEGKQQNEDLKAAAPVAEQVVEEQAGVSYSVSQSQVRMWRDTAGDQQEVRVESSYSVQEIDGDQLPQTAVIRERDDDLAGEAPAPKRIKVDKDLRRVVVKQPELRPEEKRQILIPQQSSRVP